MKQTFCFFTSIMSQRQPLEKANLNSEKFDLHKLNMTSYTAELMLKQKRGSPNQLQIFMFHQKHEHKRNK